MSSRSRMRNGVSVKDIKQLLVGVSFTLDLEWHPTNYKSGNGISNYS